MIQQRPTTLLVSMALLLSSTTVGLAQQPVADLVLQNGNIYTVDDARPTAEAIAIKKNRILAVGSDEEIKPLIGQQTQIVSLGGSFVMPGFIEGHAHFLGLGESKMMLDLTTAKTWDDIVEQVHQAAIDADPGQWIVGRGWHQDKWVHPPDPNIDGYPTDAKINEVTPGNPVLLTHASGHMIFANEYARRLAGVDSTTPNPPGGDILKNDNGTPSGVFRERAQGLIHKARANELEKRSVADTRKSTLRAVELATQECLRNGVTSFQDAGSSLQTIRFLKTLAQQKKLGIRLWVMIRDRNDKIFASGSKYKMIGYGDDFLTVRAIKRAIDGALGPHGAWMLAPYEDLPNSSGLNTSSIDSLTKTANFAIKNGFQMCVHAIGDRANQEVLNIYEQKFKEFPSAQPLRWRIEHAQHLDPADIGRFGRLGVIASMQAVHCTSDAVFVPKRLGIRRSEQGAYVWKSLLDSGAIVTNGTDAPVESVNPIASFYASVTRRLSPDVTFFPNQSMTREQAIKAYTIDAAYAAFEETSKGSLVPGKLADIVVLSNDLLKCEEHKIKDTEVLLTIVDGKIVYQKQKP